MASGIHFNRDTQRKTACYLNLYVPTPRTKKNTARACFTKTIAQLKTSDDKKHNSLRSDEKKHDSWSSDKKFIVFL